MEGRRAGADSAASLLDAIRRSPESGEHAGGGLGAMTSEASKECYHRVRVFTRFVGCPDARQARNHMSVLIGISCLGAALAVFAGWLVLRPLTEERAVPANSPIEDLLPFHPARFSQFRQSLETADKLKSTRTEMTNGEDQPWSEERRRLLKAFLTSLGEDFAKLQRLDRLVHSVSSPRSARHDFDCFLLATRFRLSYRGVAFKITSGRLDPMADLLRMSELLGSIWSRVEGTMVRPGETY